jgi:hypothetical protein
LVAQAWGLACAFRKFVNGVAQMAQNGIQEDK